MHRWWLVAVVLVCVGTLQGVQEPSGGPPKKAEPPTSLAARYAELQKEYDTTYQQLRERYRNASTDEESRAIWKEMQQLHPKYAERMLTLVGNDAHRPEAFEPLVQAMILDDDGPVGMRAVELLGQHHASHPQLILTLVQQANPEAFPERRKSIQKLLETLKDQATDRSVKGAATFLWLVVQIEKTDQRMITSKQLLDKRSAAFAAIREQLQQVVRDYGDVALPPPYSKTIAQAAAEPFYFLDHLVVGKVLPDVEVQDLDGKKVKISDYRGQVVVLDVWTTWCGPCREMIPHLQEMTERFQDKPFVLISLSCDQKKEVVSLFVRAMKMTWVHWWNGGTTGAAMDKYRIRYVPTIFVLDAKGVIRYKHLRGMALEKAVEELLQEMAAK